MVVDRQHKRQGHHRANQVAGQHDPLTVKAVQDHAGQGTRHDRRYGSRQHDAAHHEARMGGLHRQAEHRDVVEVIAELAYHLANPGVAIIAVLAQKLAKIIQHRGSIPLKNHPRSFPSRPRYECPVGHIGRYACFTSSIRLELPNRMGLARTSDANLSRKVPDILQHPGDLRLSPANSKVDCLHHVHDGNRQALGVVHQKTKVADTLHDLRGSRLRGNSVGHVAGSPALIVLGRESVGGDIREGLLARVALAPGRTPFGLRSRRANVGGNLAR